MRIVDADALPRRELWTWQSGVSVAAVTATDLDAAPTIGCAACAYADECKHDPDILMCHHFEALLGK